MPKKYGIGLDIGTSSIGWSVVDGTGHIIRVKGQTGLGVRLFREGETAAERRSFRTSRRRLARRRWRLRLLRDFFDEAISQVDINFFARQKLSSLSPKDQRFKTPYQLFNDRKDVDFYQKYPTIYHLRQALMTDKRQFDIREIYLAIHHIVKYRGHFLTGGPAQNFKPGKLELKKYFDTINAQLDALPLSEPWQLPDLDEAAVVDHLTDMRESRQDRQRALVKVLVERGDKRYRKQYTEVAKAILGLKTKLYVITGLDATVPDQKTLTFSLSELEDHRDDLTDLMGDEQVQLIDVLARLYAAIQLAIIIPSGQTFSGQMVQLYARHQQDLKWFKQYGQHLGRKDRQALKSAYAQYIDSDIPRDEFYKLVSKVLKKTPEDTLGQKIQTRIDQENFMPKQRTKANSAIPHQVQQQELDMIIKNQAVYYPWLAEANPVEAHILAAPYKLDELVDFRVPYYVGPLVSGEQLTKETKFAWMKRQNPDDKTPITPWNFDDKVDRMASADRFIQRMKTTDTYLIGEDVLPKNSLTYQRFEVLNELNNVRVNGELLTTKQKQRIYRQLFLERSKATVTIKDLKDNLLANGDVLKRPEIGGLADTKRFLSSLSTYHDYQKIIPEALKQADKLPDIEAMINWSTVFEDASIFRKKLETVNWLTEGQRRQLSQKRYRGWGQLSQKLLTKLRDQQQESVLDQLWTSSRNFMQIIRQPEFQKKIAQVNHQDLSQQSLTETIDQMYTSPQNKKAIRQVLAVVADIQAAMHGVAPSWLFIEAARGAEVSRRTKSRQAQLLDAYQNSAKELVDVAIHEQLISVSEDHQRFTDRMVLYFQQNGRDIYTGEKIDFERLSEYDIDHIIPQAVVKDDSLDNRVLTLGKINREKGERVPGSLYASQQGRWRMLQRSGLISRRKLDHLLMKPEDLDRRATGFIARQLVETRQVIKLVTDVLSQNYDSEKTKIVSVKAGLSHQFRQRLSLPKLRDLNDYHHAHDAYLAARIGTYLLQRYPNLERFFVYGEFQTSKIDLRRHFNFIGEMLKGHRDDDVVIKSPTTQKVIWDKQDEINYVEHLMSLKHLLVTHEVYDNRGALFDQTVYKATAAKKLIRRKENLPTEIYGGFSGEKTGYLAIVRVHHKGIVKYLVMRVPVRWISYLQKLSDSQQKAFLSKQYAKILVSRGKAIPFEVVAPHVYQEQTVADNIHDQKHRFSLGTNTYYHNQQQLVLPLDMQRNLQKHQPDDQELMAVYEAICQQVEVYFPLYELNRFKTKLLAAREKLSALSVADTKKGSKVILGKKSVLIRLLQGLHANPGIVNLGMIGCPAYFGKLQVPGGLQLTSQAILINESPTGLFQRDVRLSDL